MRRKVVVKCREFIQSANEVSYESFSRHRFSKDSVIRELFKIMIGESLGLSKFNNTKKLLACSITSNHDFYVFLRRLHSLFDVQKPEKMNQPMHIIRYVVKENDHISRLFHRFSGITFLIDYFKRRLYNDQFCDIGLNNLTPLEDDTLLRPLFAYSDEKVVRKCSTTSLETPVGISPRELPFSRPPFKNLTFFGKRVGEMYVLNNASYHLKILRNGGKFVRRAREDPKKKNKEISFDVRIPILKIVKLLLRRTRNRVRYESIINVLVMSMHNSRSEAVRKEIIKILALFSERWDLCLNSDKCQTLKKNLFSWRWNGIMKKIPNVNKSDVAYYLRILHDYISRTCTKKLVMRQVVCTNGDMLFRIIARQRKHPKILSVWMDVMEVLWKNAPFEKSDEYLYAFWRRSYDTFIGECERFKNATLDAIRKKNEKKIARFVAFYANFLRVIKEGKYPFRDEFDFMFFEMIPKLLIKFVTVEMTNIDLLHQILTFTLNFISLPAHQIRTIIGHMNGEYLQFYIRSIYTLFLRLYTSPTIETSHISALKIIADVLLTFVMARRDHPVIENIFEELKVVDFLVGETSLESKYFISRKNSLLRNKFSGSLMKLTDFGRALSRTELNIKPFSERTEYSFSPSVSFDNLAMQDQDRPASMSQSDFSETDFESEDESDDESEGEGEVVEEDEDGETEHSYSEGDEVEVEDSESEEEEEEEFQQQQAKPPPPNIVIPKLCLSVTDVTPGKEKRERQTSLHSGQFPSFVAKSRGSTPQNRSLSGSPRSFRILDHLEVEKALKSVSKLINRTYREKHLEEAMNDFKIYLDSSLHVKLLTLLLRLLLDTNELVLNARYLKRTPYLHYKCNILYILNYHINHDRNEDVVRQLMKDSMFKNYSYNILFRLLNIKMFDFNDEYDYLKQIGKGAFGDIFAVKAKTTNVLYALKRISIERDYTQTVVSKVFNEILVMIKCKDKFPGSNKVAKLVDFGVDERYYYMVMKLYRCNLRQWRNKQPEKSLRGNYPLYITIFRKVLEAYKEFSECNINHFDLKCENIYLDDDCNSLNSEFDKFDFYNPVNRDANFDIVLGDFGESHVFSENENGHLNEYRGTQNICSPEMILVEVKSRKKKEGDVRDDRMTIGANSKSDIWSLGCLFYELLTNEFLFDSQEFGLFFHTLTEPTAELITKEHFRKFQYDNFVYDFLQSMLERDWRKRPDINTVLRNARELEGFFPSLDDHRKKVDYVLPSKKKFEENSSRKPKRARV